MGERRGLMGTVSLLALGAGCVIAAAPAADARVTQIQIASKQVPAFGGYALPGVGQYEKIVGKAFGELNPNDPEERGHRRHPARAAQRERQRRVLVRLLHPEADRPDARAITRSCTSRRIAAARRSVALNRACPAATILAR